ncbi:tetratricopeptide repeat protein [Cetobacterium sp.]|uniref:tetratricopeptide repeat protein n=1 Tax=Cetobacterium sp. TaxID=2071632 RepID=UPI003EE7A3CD
MILKSEIEDKDKEIKKLYLNLEEEKKIKSIGPENIGLMYNLDQTYRGVKEYYQSAYENLLEIFKIIGGAFALFIGLISLKNSYELFQAKKEIKDDVESKIKGYESAINLITETASKEAVEKVKLKFDEEKEKSLLLIKTELEKIKTISLEVELNREIIFMENILRNKDYGYIMHSVRKLEEIIKKIEYDVYKETNDKLKGKVYLMYGSLKEKMGLNDNEVKEVIEIYNKALELGEDSEEIYIRLSVVYYKVRDYKKSKDIILEGLKKYNESEKLLYGLFKVEEDKDKRDKILKKIGEINPENNLYNYEMAVKNFIENNWNIAIDFYKKAVKENNNEMDIYEFFYSNISSLKEKFNYTEEQRDELLKILIEDTENEGEYYPLIRCVRKKIRKVFSENK